MRRTQDGRIVFAPSDLVRFAESPFAAAMDRWALDEPDLNPDPPDPMQTLLAERGRAHEAAYRTTLEATGVPVTDIEPGATSLRDTRRAMRERAPVVFQAHLADSRFSGFADFLRLEPEATGCPYSIWDTKLATRTKPQYLVQLCCYADMLGETLGARPQTLGIVLGSGEEAVYRTDEFFRYYRVLRRAFLDAMTDFDPETVPLPDPRADHGRWATRAEEVLARRDHLSRVARITQGQVLRFERAGIETATALATTTARHVPGLDDRVFHRLHRQAALQNTSRAAERPSFEVVPPAPDDPHRGLALLPPPSPMDVYFDIEGDPLFESDPSSERGLEYLWGATHVDDGSPAFWDAWAFDAVGEKAAFERFVDWVIERWRADRTMHVYHYAPYEVTALKRLMSKYTTREDEVDHLLRSGVLVDLYAIVRNGVRVGTQSYSLKDIEKLYATRQGDVESGGQSIVEFERFLTSGEPSDWRASPILRSLREYNRFDCESTWQLATWLRKQQQTHGIAYDPVPRDVDEDVRVPDGDRGRRHALAQSMLAKATAAPEAIARIGRLMAHLLEFHRREGKPVWWSYFERHAQTALRHIEDLTCIGDAVLESGPVSVRQSQGYWYRFDPDQDTKIGAGDDVEIAGERGASFQVEDIHDDRLLVVASAAKIARLSSSRMPAQCSFLRHRYFRTTTIEASIERTAGAFHTSQALPAPLPNLLAGTPPPIEGHRTGPLLQDDEDVVDGVLRLVRHMRGGTLAVQGPPGAGKTYTASRVILALLQDGQNVGVTSNSHQAILNLMEAVNDCARGALRCLKVGDTDDHPFFAACPGAVHVGSGADGAATYASGLIGGTAWLFSREDMAGRLDTLFVDEAGQVSLANLVGMAPSARNIVLLGDQMQLAQPTQGTHPGESGQGALQFALGQRKTVPPEQGVFLPTTYRLHPDVCHVVSGAIYEGRLRAAPVAAGRTIHGADTAGHVPLEAGICFSAVEHEGNRQASDEEVERVRAITNDLLGRPVTDDGTVTGTLSLDDILYVAPFNLQVRRLREALPDGAQVGSVDKFQGREARVVVVSLCRSPGEARASGRGLEFVLDLNRLNVAISRAQSLAIVVGDPRLVLGRANSVDAMRRANLLAWIMERAGAKTGGRAHPGSQPVDSS